MPAVEDLVNSALVQIGHPRRIGDIYEGSPPARAALEFYGQTRDEILAAKDWPFAIREVALATNNQTPPSPWPYEYAYPGDCLRIRYVRPGPLTGGGRSLDPQPVLYRPWNDARPATPVRAILCDLGGAVAPVLIYTGRVTDPATWEPSFIRELIDRLAVKLAFRLAQQAEMVRARLALAAASEAEESDDMTAPERAMPAPPAQGR